MRQTISIDPVTRIEGHARVFLDLADDGSLEDAGLVVNELRGFERILVGMEADRMPQITARICGVCPSAHHLAASKALDRAAGVEPPPAAKLIRELLYMGHFIHSHALSLFVLQGPDLVMGLNADPAVRNVVGVVKAAPEIAKKALRLRTIGQRINELVGGRGVHPVTSVAGGVTFRMDEDRRRVLRGWIDEALPLGVELAGVARSLLLKQLELHPSLLSGWNQATWHQGTTQDGVLNLYDGLIRQVDDTGRQRYEFDAIEYDTHLVESTFDWSYMKPVMARDGDAMAMYRVGPQARLNAAASTGTPAADGLLNDMRSAFGHPINHVVLQIYARVIELVYACERAKALIEDEAITGPPRVPVTFKGSRGVAHVEAPRGTLIHDYTIDERGVVRAANLIVATQQNYAAINKSIAQAATTHVIDRGDEQVLNAVEFAIRCYDPCLSCATHAVGQMPLELVIRQRGQVLRTARR
ncbi:MAG: Ni/Fe hydrogenase subunit alpha [Acidobacteriota bacterium]